MYESAIRLLYSPWNNLDVVAFIVASTFAALDRRRGLPTTRNMANDPFTAEQMLSLPRPGAAVPSPGGLRYAQSTSTYSFEAARTSRSIYVASVPQDGNLLNGEPKEALADLQYLEYGWLSDDTLLYLRPLASTIDEPDHSRVLKDEDFKKLGEERDERGIEVWVKQVDEDGRGAKLGQLPVECVLLRLLARRK